MPAELPLLRECLRRARAVSGALLRRCLEPTISALQEAERQSMKSTERQRLADAWRELQASQASWTQRFPDVLAERMAAAPPAAESGEPVVAIKAAPRKLHTLTLVEDAAVAHTIESSRLTQTVLPFVEQPLAELDALMSALLGLPAVRPERNPLRPEVFAQALRTLLGESSQVEALSGVWLPQLAPVLGRELDIFYRELVAQLKAANVQAAGYRVLAPAPGAGGTRPTAAAAAAAAGPALPASGGQGQGGAVAQHGAGAPGARAMPSWAGSAEAAGSAWADLSQVQIGDALVQDFLWHGGQAHQQALAPAYYTRVEQELADLQAQPPEAAPVFQPPPAHWRELPVVDRPQRDVGVDSPLPDGRWGQWAAPRERSLLRSQLKQQAQQVGQVLGLEVVRKLVDQVGQDARLLTPVREAIVALEPTLLRLALQDPRFFGNEAHPARRLVERVAERSFKYNDEFSGEFQSFADSVAAVFNDLNRQPDGDVAPVEQALAGLEARWQAQDDEEAQHGTEVLDAMRFAEERQAEADRIAWELSQRADLDNVPAVVQDFLFGPWALVMAQARLADGRRHIDPGGYGAVISDLLWSVKREATLREPARAFEVIPRVLQRLRAGLAALGQDGQEAETFFGTLEKLHRPVLKLRARHRREVLDSAAMPLEPEGDMPEPVARRQPQPAGEQLWLGREELDAAGFSDTLPTDYAALAELHESQPASLAGEPEAADAFALPIDPALVVAGLREGCWVDLHSRGQWLRARLIWASTKSTLFMFTSQGGQPHSMTRRSLERLIRERLLRPVDMQGVVALALDNLSHRSTPPDAAPSQPQALVA